MSKESWSAVSFTSEDLRKYQQNSDGKSLAGVGGLAFYTSRIFTPGLKSLNDALSLSEQESVKLDNYATTLLEDLRAFSQRPGFEAISSRYNIPEFQEKFLEEATKPNEQRSTEYHEFIKAFADIPITQFAPEIISARALVAINEGKSAQEIRNQLANDFAEFNQAEQKQAEADFKRADIFLKEKDGEVVKVSKKDLEAKPEEFGLTQGQVEAIKLFNQSEFDGGMHVLSQQLAPEGEQYNPNLTGSSDRTNLLIDLTGPEVVFSARLVLSAKSLEDAKEYPAVENAVSLVVPKEGFGKPGCGQEPKISYNIRRVMDGTRVEVPSDLKVQEENLEQINKIREANIQGYLNSISESEYTAYQQTVDPEYLKIEAKETDVAGLRAKMQQFPDQTLDIRKEIAAANAVIKELKQKIASENNKVPSIAKFEAVAGGREEAGRLVKLKTEYEKVKDNPKEVDKLIADYISADKENLQGTKEKAKKAQIFALVDCNIEKQKAFNERNNITKEDLEVANSGKKRSLSVDNSSGVLNAAKKLKATLGGFLTRNSSATNSTPSTSPQGQESGWFK